MKKEKEKVKIINIYLTYQDKKILSEIRDKYHISYSTIAKVIFTILIKNTDSISYQIWSDHYFYQEKNSTKTSIKPNLIGLWQQKNVPMTMLLTNMIKAFTRNEIGKHTGWEEKEVQKRKSQIYNQFTQEYDPNWNGNAFAHQFARFVKRNPDYTRRIMEGEK